MTSRFRRVFAVCAAFLAAGLTPAPSLRAETGYDLWLRYTPVADAALRASYRQAVTAIVPA
ncbi:MAG TPA: hypothetical protein VKI43_08015, partial [Vicinamibacterales bacterium]|nr:hypothetical protein [Vicinamibacterales bacterium]